MFNIACITLSLLRMTTCVDLKRKKQNKKTGNCLETLANRPDPEAWEVTIRARVVSANSTNFGARQAVRKTCCEQAGVVCRGQKSDQPATERIPEAAKHNRSDIQTTG